MGRKARMGRKGKEREGKEGRKTSSAAHHCLHGESEQGAQRR